MARPPELSLAEFGVIAEHVRQHTGIDLDSSKTYLVETRLGPLVAEEGCGTYFELYRRVRDNPRGPLAGRVVDAISTQETSFFRDAAPFELLRRRLVPRHVQRLSRAGLPRQLRIWSAGCSTGQEAYSIAATVHECLPEPSSWNVSIVGTDISEAALSRARAGLYRQLEVERGLTAEQRDGYLDRTAEGWLVRTELRRMTRFAAANLMTLPGQWEAFDLIFCRNVAIYFSVDSRVRLFAALEEHLLAGGALVLGSSETLAGISTRFRPQRADGSVYYALGEDEAGP